MNKRKSYENAEVEVIYLKNSDVITTSITMGDDNNTDDGGWTEGKVW